MYKIIIFLFAAIFLQIKCSSVDGHGYDINPYGTVGTTFQAGWNSSFTSPIPEKNKKGELVNYYKKQPIPFIMTSVPQAEFVSVAEFRSREWAVFACYFGPAIGNGNSNGNIEDRLNDKINFQQLPPPKEGYIYIINNIQVELNTNGALEFWNNYLGAIFYRTNSYEVVAELAQIKAEDLSAYIMGIKSKATELPKTMKRIIFSGIVFTVMGNDLTVASAKTANARIGNEITFVDRNGKEIAKGTITQVMHTNVKVKIKEGKVEKGFSAFIYGN
ncbi:MAG: hypothetical protein IT569_05840 [Leptospiraceae bacterium]|nr:hypothetical protein [Leptospiraceae bacterium]